MKVVILCGGQGTRLREETEFRPKPMVPIGGRPILWHIMKSYAHHGHKEFILCLGYKGDQIKDYFRNYQWNTSDVTIRLGATPEIKYYTRHDEDDWSVTLVDTGQDTMTGGRVRRILPFIKDDHFLLTYGDGLSSHDINASIDYHLAKRALVTLTAVHPEGRFGELAINEGLIESFHEKPDREDNFINGGFFVCQKGLGDYLTGDDCILERAPLESVAREGRLGAYQHRGFWQCMDTYRESQMLNQMWDTGKAPWKQW
ncbi:MAG: glucose-1-phosphate cytidylyltransferase [Verrucomicrobiales bacterium]